MRSSYYLHLPHLYLIPHFPMYSLPQDPPFPLNMSFTEMYLLSITYFLDLHSADSLKKPLSLSTLSSLSPKPAPKSFPIRENRLTSLNSGEDMLEVDVLVAVGEGTVKIKKKRRPGRGEDYS
ncbi:hypothetical protein L1987_33238 [Smallanthus sonchifolius]|uniref:Uncharacterized protein n=1 Tax=Smallanthus sonchifolius TaxID=185202 RepID=A0ACB9HRN5_9ASTR|nr:hypothetical protein L1987_33238 [Smallanthus sonchifolius]